ncbi:uncharacterized protein PV07_01079 [Cladophialophora immunda]|uniref:Uncharacterized protein n=1 Tax=Cladophialophora immunda TaxID=569365 RepID=A0A0D2A1P6_9EURO|nr:uncharacterized protein PV07_01079 [Cladophialophora immunda]KIW34291.1 hypothetical protein PV07_01079 [Cladophialophora immunda]
MSVNKRNRNSFGNKRPSKAETAARKKPSILEGLNPPNAAGVQQLVALMRRDRNRPFSVRPELRTLLKKVQAEVKWVREQQQQQQRRKGQEKCLRERLQEATAEERYCSRLAAEAEAANKAFDERTKAPVAETATEKEALIATARRAIEEERLNRARDRATDAATVKNHPRRPWTPF